MRDVEWVTVLKRCYFMTFMTVNDSFTPKKEAPRLGFTLLVPPRA